MRKPIFFIFCTHQVSVPSTVTETPSKNGLRALLDLDGEWDWVELVGKF